MRKLAVVLFAVGSLCLMAFPAFAEKGDMAFGLNGGLAMPMGQLADEDYADMKMGPDFGLGFDYFITKDFALGLDGSYVMMTANESDDVKAKTMAFGVHGKYFVPTGGQFMPYLNLGVGMYNRKVEFSGDAADFLGEDNVSDNTFGLNAGVGVEYKVTPKIGIGVNGAYIYTFGEFKPEVGGEEVSLLDDWNYINFNAAVTFYFPMSK
jgi:opacity protein-like surface antigen